MTLLVNHQELLNGNKKAHYDDYKKNPNDKIYKMINKKDIENYEKAYAKVEVFVKQFPHLRNLW